MDAALNRLRAFPFADGPRRTGRRTEDEAQLALFCLNRRREYHAGQLSADRIAELESIPWWSWDPLADAFAVEVNRLRAFPDRPRRRGTRTEDEAQLALFSSNRRREYHAGQLSADRIAVLESIPWWSWNFDSAAMLESLPSWTWSSSLQMH